MAENMQDYKKVNTLMINFSILNKNPNWAIKKKPVKQYQLDIRI